MNGPERDKAPETPVSGKREKDFSAYHRENREAIDPKTGEKIQLLTKKQYEAFQKELKKPE